MRRRAEDDCHTAGSEELPAAAGADGKQDEAAPPTKIV